MKNVFENKYVKISVKVALEVVKVASMAALSAAIGCEIVKHMGITFYVNVPEDVNVKDYAVTQVPEIQEIPEIPKVEAITQDTIEAPVDAE